MKPAAFDYRCPDSLDEALRILADAGDGAKVLAGGQSLLPMLNLRIVRPRLVVDIGRLLELDYLRRAADGGLCIGALTRHRVLESSPLVAAMFPVVPEVMPHVAHLAIRNRGTLGGSLSHADPAAELPLLARLLDATLVVRSAAAERRVAARDFFLGPLSPALRPEELLVAVEIPALAHQGWGFDEVARRAGDFALAAAGVVLQVEQGRIACARVALTGVGDVPLRCPGAEALLAGRELDRAPDQALLERAAQAACDGLQPRQDLQASAALRLHLAAVVVHRALRKAWQRATGAA